MTENEIEWADEREKADTVTLTCGLCKARGPHELHTYASGTWARCLVCLNWWRYAPPPKYTYGADHE